VQPGRAAEQREHGQRAPGLSYIIAGFVNRASKMRSMPMRRLMAARPRPGARTFITRVGYNLAKKMMPKISDTEQVSLGCGTVGFDRDIFSGSPSLSTLLNTYEAKLTTEERSFLDNEVNELCRMIDDHRVTTEKVECRHISLLARAQRRTASCSRSPRGGGASLKTAPLRIVPFGRTCPPRRGTTCVTCASSR